MPAESGLSRKTVYLTVLGAIVALVLILRMTVFAPDPVEVRVEASPAAPCSRRSRNSKAGTVEARRRSRIAAEIGGRVVEVRHREGASVKAGEPLIRLGEESLRARSRADEGRRARRRPPASKTPACAAIARAASSTARGASPSRTSPPKIASTPCSTASIRRGSRARRRRRSCPRRERICARRNRSSSKTLIVAPFDGVVAEVNVEVGEWVTPSPPLLTSPAVIDLIDPTSIYVSAPMDEVDAGAIVTGLPVKVSVDSRPGQSFPGRVARVAPYVLDTESQNRTLEIEVSLDDPKVAESLLPGTSADAEVILETRYDVVRIPTSALLRSEKVLVLEDGVLVEREVELGLRNWQYAEVTRGLELGEQVVVALDAKEVVAGARAVASNPEAASADSGAVAESSARRSRERRGDPCRRSLAHLSDG